MASSLLATSSLSSDCITGIRWTSEVAPRSLPQISTRRNCVRLLARAQTEPDSTVQPSEALPPRKKKEKVAVKKQQVMLKFVWMEKNIGIGLDHVIPGHGTIPLSPYYFWPRKDAWEEIKTKLESKKWISRKQTILLLNQATDIINLWQQNATS